MKPFPCTQCGLCCQNVHRSAQTAFLDRGDGTCRHYQIASKQCAIYATCPDICRVDRQYALHYRNHYTWDEFVAANLRACAWLETATSPSRLHTERPARIDTPPHAARSSPCAPVRANSRMNR